MIQKIMEFKRYNHLGVYICIGGVQKNNTQEKRIYMDFNETIKQFSKRAATIKDTASTEEATKMSLMFHYFKYWGTMCLTRQNFAGIHC